VYPRKTSQKIAEKEEESLASAFSHPSALQEELAQDIDEGGCGRDLTVGDTALFGDLFDVLEEAFEFIEVVGTDAMRINLEASCGFFDIFKERLVAEGKVDLIGIEEMKEDDIMAAMAKLFEFGCEGFGLGEEIGEDEDHATTTGDLAKALEHERERRLALGRLLLNRMSEREEVRGMATGRELMLDGIIEAHQADGIALTQEDIRERERERAGITVLCGSFGERIGMMWVVHGGGGIEEEISAEIGLILELLDVVAVAFRQEPPIEMAEIIARRIFFMLGEFDALSAMGALMKTCEQALDIAQGFESNGRKLREDRRIDPSHLAAHADSLSKAAITSSARMPSDSAS
jgi:hypothetical protein